MISLYQGAPASPCPSPPRSQLTLAAPSPTPAGGAIMLASLILFESEFLNIVSISFSALVLNELVMVAVEITTWHTLMVVSEVVTLALYVVSILFLPEYFGASPPPSSAPRARCCRAGADSRALAPPYRARRPLVRAHDRVRVARRPHRRHLGRAPVGAQVPQGQVCPDPVRQAARLLNPSPFAVHARTPLSPSL